MIHKVHGLLNERGFKVAVAESCTGGLVARALSFIPGSSGCFDSSIVCYSRHSKHRLLGLSESFLARYGTVSEETARAIAQAAREKAGVEVGIGVTGITGPGTIEDKEVGLVFVAVSIGERIVSRRLKFGGERDEIRHSTVNYLLQLLYEELSA